MRSVNPSETTPASVLTPEEAAARMTPDQLAQYVGRPPQRGISAKILGAVLIAAVGLGASALSCVGQFSLRQARALEGIEQHLLEIERSCAGSAVAPSALTEGSR
jgi:hypothetical protein